MKCSNFFFFNYKKVIKIEIQNFDVNIFRLLKDVYSDKITREENEIGCSEVSYCARKTIIKRLKNIKFEGNNKTLIGTLFHSLIQNEEMLVPLIHEIDAKLNQKPTKKAEITTEKNIRYELSNDNFLVGHVDVEVPYYIVEIKTTQIYARSFERSITGRYFIQGNLYTSITKKDFGFVTTLNLRAFQNDFKTWDKLWMDNGYILPFRTNELLFNASIEKCNLIFNHLSKNDYDIECHPADWECSKCEVIDTCGKEFVRCEHTDEKGKQCNKKMPVWIDCLTNEFKELPLCQNCYEKKTRKRKEYLQYKIKKEFPWS